MGLKIGDYETILERICESIDSDTSEGGLRENPDPPVKTIEKSWNGGVRALRSHETPALFVSITLKEEREFGRASLRTYRALFQVVCRGADATAESALCRKIVSRLEEFLREQNDADKQFGGLPDALDWSIGALTVTPRMTRFASVYPRGEEPVYSVSAYLEVELEISARAM